MSIERKEIDIDKLITPYGLNIFSALLPNSELIFFQQIKEKGKKYEEVLKQNLADTIGVKQEKELPIALTAYGITLGASEVAEQLTQGKGSVACLVIEERVVSDEAIRKALRIYDEEELDYLLWWFLNAFSVEYEMKVQKCRKLHRSSKTISISDNSICKKIPVSEKEMLMFFKGYDIHNDGGRLSNSDAWTFIIEIGKVNGVDIANKSRVSKKIQYIVNMIFNKNSVNMLYHGKPFKYKRYISKLITYRKRINENKYNLDDFVIDSSGVLGLYGVRMPTDIDFLSIATDEKQIEAKYIQSHMFMADVYERSVSEIVNLPKNYLYFNDIKFVAPSVVLQACLNREELSKKIDGIFLSYIAKGWTWKFEYRQFFTLLKLIDYMNRKSRVIIYAWIDVKRGWEKIRGGWREIKLALKRVI